MIKVMKYSDLMAVNPEEINSPIYTELWENEYSPYVNPNPRYVNEAIIDSNQRTEIVRITKLLTIFTFATEKQLVSLPEVDQDLLDYLVKQKIINKFTLGQKDKNNQVKKDMEDVVWFYTMNYVGLNVVISYLPELAPIAYEWNLGKVRKDFSFIYEKLILLDFYLKEPIDTATHMSKLLEFHTPEVVYAVSGNMNRFDFSFYTKQELTYFGHIGFVIYPFQETSVLNATVIDQIKKYMINEQYYLRSFPKANTNPEIILMVFSKEQADQIRNYIYLNDANIPYDRIRFINARKLQKLDGIKNTSLV
ncbi:hypothetical protein EFL77_08455 [Pediococcus pentosaceus]|uniref:hypothetical protein n=1 Tax=Pediococcus pentosaceus TaxID=1255 RepID=UPI00223BD4A8|nr:hypothetical protein [Pediococcus pentosaceus]MCT1178526.1 hypothetical protein [Pediococcus pentosaceus]